MAVLLTSLACYLLYYRLEPRRAYVAGAVPLAAVGLFAAAMAVVAALIRYTVEARRRGGELTGASVYWSCEERNPA